MLTNILQYLESTALLLRVRQSHSPPHRPDRVPRLCIGY